MDTMVYLFRFEMNERIENSASVSVSDLLESEDNCSNRTIRKYG